MKNFDFDLFTLKIMKNKTIKLKVTKILQNIS